MPILLPLDILLPFAAVAAFWWLVRHRTRLWVAYGIASLVYTTVAALIAVGQGYSLSIYVILAASEGVRALLNAPRDETLTLSRALFGAAIGIVVLPTIILLIGSGIVALIERARHAAPPR